MSDRRDIVDALVVALRPLIADLVDAAIDERLAELEAAGSRRRRWLTLDEAGELLGCSRDAVRKRADRGRLESRHHGDRRYVSAESVERLSR